LAFFDTFAATEPTAAGWRLMRRLNRHHTAVLSRLCPDARVMLEIGPGVGPFAEACREAGLDYTAIEPNPKLADALEARGFKVERAVVPPLPAKDASVCIVHASHVIEHNPTFREALEFIAESKRALRRGGLLSLVGPDFDHLGNEFYQTHYSHSLPINLRRLVQLVSDSGLAIRHTDFLSGPFRAPLRLLTQTAAKYTPSGLIWLASLGRLSPAQAYSAKMTFMRSVWVVGERVD
jgi:SAM-dependent methyltransferase